MKQTSLQILNVLQQAKGCWVHYATLAAVGGVRFGGRLFELRREGYDIEQRGSGRSSQYRLISSPPPQYPTLECVCGWAGTEPQAHRDLDGLLCPRCARTVGERQTVLFAEEHIGR